jgi:hypothetical protein
VEGVISKDLKNGMHEIIMTGDDARLVTVHFKHFSLVGIPVDEAVIALQANQQVMTITSVPPFPHSVKGLSLSPSLPPSPPFPTVGLERVFLQRR